MTTQRHQEEFASLEAEIPLEEFYEIAYNLGCRSVDFASGRLASVNFGHGYDVREIAETDVNLAFRIGRDEHGLANLTEAQLADDKAGCDYGVYLSVESRCDPLPLEAWQVIESSSLPVKEDSVMRATWEYNLAIHILGADVEWEEGRTYTIWPTSENEDSAVKTTTVPVDLDIYDPSLDVLIPGRKDASEFSFLQAEIQADRQQRKLSQAALVVRSIADFKMLPSIGFAMPTNH